MFQIALIIELVRPDLPQNLLPFFPYIVGSFLVGWHLLLIFLTSGISDDSQSPTSGEYNVCISIKDPCTPETNEDGFQVIRDSNLLKVMN